jgi:hypothetical protein
MDSHPSPLLLAQRAPVSPGLGPSAGVPLPRKNSTGSFSKLSEFWLDGTPSVPGTPGDDANPLTGVPNITLSIDAS